MTSEPLAFGEPPAAKSPRRVASPEPLETTARRVLKLLAPLEADAQSRVLRATAILLGLGEPLARP